MPAGRMVNYELKGSDSWDGPLSFPFYFAYSAVLISLRIVALATVAFHCCMISVLLCDAPDGFYSWDCGMWESTESLRKLTATLLIVQVLIPGILFLLPIGFSIYVCIMLLTEGCKKCLKK